MSKVKHFFRGRSRFNAHVAAANQPGQERGPDGQYLVKGASVRSLAVVVVETRQQRRYMAQQAAKGGKA
jgi:hypothetical protein